MRNNVMKLFGSSGVRRLYGEELVDLALRIGSVIGRDASCVVIGGDTRTTSALLGSALTSGVLSAGANVASCGIAPTPTVAYATRYADTGCMITASHNPEPYNGFKLLNPDGSSYNSEQQEMIEQAITHVEWGGWDRQGAVKHCDAVSRHAAAIELAITVSGDLRAVVDCGNGAGSVITPTLLSHMGIHTIPINCTPSGIFPRPSEPLEENLPYMGALIRDTGSGCGIVHDGDADRMMAFDASGRYISGDRMLMLMARYLSCRRVVTTVDASMAIEEIAEVRRTPVGDTFVSEELVCWGDFGGEPSGSWIFPDHSYCPDGVYAAALFCEIASEWDVAEELDSMPSYPILRESLRADSPGDVLMAIGAAEPTQGVRLEEEDGWCLIRASGTEPKIRITAEGTTLPKAKELLEKGRQIIKTAKTA